MSDTVENRHCVVILVGDPPEKPGKSGNLWPSGKW